MIRTLSALACVMAVAAPAAAQDLEALARQYAEMPATQRMMDEMMSPETLIAQFMATIPPGTEVSEDQQARIGALMAEALSDLRPQMEEAMVASTAATFTAPELEALIAFYGSEVGASVMGKMQPMMQDFMGRLGPEMGEMQRDLIPEVVRILGE